MQTEITKEYVEQLEQAIEAQDTAFILSTMEEMYPPDITTVLYELNAEQSKFVMDLLPAEVGAEILSDLDPDIRVDFLRVFTSEEIARFVSQMDSDDAVDVLNEQSVQRREEIIALIGNEEKIEDIIDLLHYAGVLGPPNSSKPREVLVDMLQLEAI